jgi:hypothetical protein
MPVLMMIKKKTNQKIVETDLMAFINLLASAVDAHSGGTDRLTRTDATQALRKGRGIVMGLSAP